MGVIFFIINAVFSLVLLILVLLATIYAFVRKNPDSRYLPMTDDRASFIKSNTGLTTELDALGATARGDKAGYKHNLDLDDDNDSWSSDSMRNPTNMPLPPSTAGTGAYRDSNPSVREAPNSPIDPSVPLFPATGSRGPPPNYQDGRPNSNAPLIYGNDRSNNASPAPYRDNNQSTSNLSTGYRSQNSGSPAPGGSDNLIRTRAMLVLGNVEQVMIINERAS
ncbi:transient receptor potential ion channel [Botrytis cinerea]